MNMFASLAEPMCNRPGVVSTKFRVAALKPPVQLIARAPDAPANPWGLTGSEWEVFKTMCEVGSNKETAAALGLSKKTIEQHLRTARKKMGASDRLLAALAWDRFTRQEKA